MEDNPDGIYEDPRVGDGKALLRLLEGLVLEFKYMSSSTTGTTSESSVAEVMQAEHVREGLPHAAARVDVGAETLDVVQSKLGRSSEEEVTETIIGFLGNSGICRNCGTVQHFHEENFRCQHYCRGCFPKKPDFCPGCDLCLCVNDEDTRTCESCLETYHDGCGDLSDRFGALLCAACEGNFDDGAFEEYQDGFADEDFYEEAYYDDYEDDGDIF